MPVFYVHYPMAMTIDSDSFNSAAKQFLKMNRHYNIQQLIMSDQMNKYKNAIIRNYVVNGVPKSRISLSSYKPVPSNSPVVAVQPDNFPVPLLAPGFAAVAPNVVGDLVSVPMLLKQ